MISFSLASITIYLLANLTFLYRSNKLSCLILYLNGNKKLDRNADGVPTEPCYMKQKVRVADHGVLLKAHLVNPAEMMGK